MSFLDDPITVVSAGQVLRDGQFAGFVLAPHEDHDDQEMERNFGRVMQEAYETFCERHAGYGRANISQIGLSGVLDRMVDKFERLKRIVQGKQGDTSLERSDDVLIDLANYALIGLLIKRGIWPVTEQAPKTLSEELRAAIYNVLVAHACQRDVAGNLADAASGYLADQAKE